MTDPTTTRITRAERLAIPLAREVVQDLAVEHGACIRPVQLRRTNLDTGDQNHVLVPCGHTLAAVCPSCAERARALRAAQCREGWHLEHEPVIGPDPATKEQRWWIQTRADAQTLRDQAASDGQDTTDLDELVTDLDDEITAAGTRQRAPGPARAAAPLHQAAPGRPGPATPQGHQPDGREDRHRSRWEDVPAVDVRHADLPQLWAGA